MSNGIYDQEIDGVILTASEVERNADRYAAELIDKLGYPTTLDQLQTMVAVAYLEGQAQQLRWARDLVRGDGPREAV